MASEAHGNVEKQLDAAREAELAAYIMRDVELRQQNARGKLSAKLLVALHAFPCPLVSVNEQAGVGAHAEDRRPAMNLAELFQQFCV